MKNWGIRARVLFLALMPSVMILLTLVTYFTYTRIAEVDVALAQHGTSVARQLAPPAEFAVFAGDRATLQRLVDAAARESDVASVTITDTRGQTLAHSGESSAAPAESVAFAYPILQTQLAADFPGQMQVTTAPAKVGEVVVTMSRATAHREQRRLLQVGLALGLLGVLVAIGLALAIGDSVIRPIQQLAVAMVELGRGGRPAPLSSSGGGEFRTLNEGFNQMVVRLQATARDLEQRIDEATRELVVQKDAAEQATNAKSRFIAAASHDLRQPLHAIGLFTGTLQRRVRGTGLEAVVEDLAQSVAVMQRLFDSLLDISRLDAEGVRPELKPFPLGRLFAQLAAEHIDAAERKRLRLYMRPTTAIVLTDELLLHRLMNNLVANAIRYTNEGTVLVCARPRGDEIQIEVRDSGMGIPVDKQGDIFQEFYQIGNAARDRSLGLGLGLAIVARIARLLNAEVVVRSAPGRGSVFRLRVSRGRSDVQSEATVTEPNEGMARLANTISILVIDDDPLVLAGNRALLEALGCEVVTVSDDERAKEALKAFGQKPILILCDLWLSDRRSGIDVLRSLSELTTATISCILISGDTRPETIQAARAAGYPMLHKPVSPARLRAVISHFASTLQKNIATDVRDENSAR